MRPKITLTPEVRYRLRHTDPGKIADEYDCTVRTVHSVRRVIGASATYRTANRHHQQRRSRIRRAEHKADLRQRRKLRREKRARNAEK